jgi:hypothetical protein
MNAATCSGPLYTETQFKDVKDPCIVYDGIRWHIYGSGGDVRHEVWQILHAVSPTSRGPWKEVAPVTMHGVRGDHVAAPSVYYDDHCFHMMVQTEFTTIGGTVEYLRSNDGETFTCINTALTSIPETTEAGIYDPHQTVIGVRKYLVYAGTPAIEGFHNQYVIQPDVYLAEGEEWNGPWHRRGIILGHDHIDWHHNRRGHHEYEWGIEGPQIICLPNGMYLLNATCFLSEGKFGTRQRVFFAIANDITGPYTSLGPVIDPLAFPEQQWMSGENGHATAIIEDEQLLLFFQGRSQQDPDASQNNWRYGIATFPLASLKVLH